MIKEVITFCPICGNHCALKAIIKDDKVVDAIAAGETGFPSHICSLRKGASHIVGILNSPDRLKYPLKRKGERGEGKWERISWDEALDTIAENLIEVRNKYGPEYVAIILGEPKGMEYAFWQRFATAFGTPNVPTPGNYCGVQTGIGQRFTFGSASYRGRMEGHMKTIIIWGSNFAHMGGSFLGIRRNDFNKALLEGCKLIVVDPRNIEMWPEKGLYASNADVWMRVRPNADGILALGMIKVIIEEDIYDKEFVRDWTDGFDEVKKEIEKFTLDDVERLTWVPKEQIIEAARIYALNKPGVIGWSNALENNAKAVQMCRAISILRGITGNVSTPYGGEVELNKNPMRFPGSFMFSGAVKERLKEFPRSAERTIGGEFPLCLTNMYIPTQSLVKALLEGVPYRPKTGIVCLNNPMLTYADSKKTYKAFLKFEFLVVAEVFHTLTTAIADIVLPAAYINEHDTISYWPAYMGHARAHPKLVDPPGEAWSDIKMTNELAKRVGLAKYFWDDENEALDFMLEPAGCTWQEFRDKIHLLSADTKYDPDKVVGFATPSGKVELASKSIEELGVTAVPAFKEFAEALSDPFELSDEYPLMFTNYKSEIFMLSGFRMVKELREKSSPPIVFMNTDTAKGLGLKDGDWVWIETRKGRVKQMLVTDPKVHRKVVNAEFGWGDTEEFPDSNVNVLTDYEPPYDVLSGTVTLRGYPCKVYKS